jgi:serine/threonine-protein kinase RsbW
VSAVQKQNVNHPHTWRKAFIGTIDDISAAAQWVDTIAAEQQFPEQLVFALQVCLEELLTNVVRMSVEDNGKPFDIVNAPAHRIDQPLDEVQPGGLGIQLIRNFASSIAYEQAGLGNRVIVEFLL